MATTDADRESSIECDVVVVGAGPAGCVLSYLLARSGVDTVLLERHSDLHREFRGFFWQPLVGRLFDEMGILEDVLALPHEKILNPHVVIYGREYEMFDFREMPGPHNYGLLMEQPPLLQLFLEQANNYPTFEYRDQTPAKDLITHDGEVVGVRATDRGSGTDLTIESRLVVGADGRYSTIRKSADIDPGMFTSRLELLWFKLPKAVINEASQVRFGAGGQLFYFGLGENEAQLGWGIKKGSYPALRKRGITHFHEQLIKTDPNLAGALPEHLPDFEDCSLLHIEPGLSEEWARDGLLLIGDAAHVASPVGAQGNSLAIQDAVVAHPIIMTTLSQTDGPLPAQALQQVEDVRKPAVEGVIRFQRRAERGFTALVLFGDRVPDSLKRLFLQTLFTIVSRTPLTRRVRDRMAGGQRDVQVATSYFIDAGR
ncbi:FAD-dependent oxidoreductase [Haladaptatus halobius]|uniref:FAD-dependent oxidoreductase n=1 Tax=Haladaptatus halobius TaxID=2884875 RepID=UPI001D09BAAB|nr:FAD-dependent oxidoreductase [Haladaptatus halobius]